MRFHFKPVLCILTILWIYSFLWSPGDGKSASKSGSKKGSKKGADFYCFEDVDIEECQSRVFESASAGGIPYDIYCKNEERETCRKVVEKASQKYQRGRCPFCSFVGVYAYISFNFRQKKAKTLSNLQLCLLPMLQRTVPPMLLPTLRRTLLLIPR